MATSPPAAQIEPADPPRGRRRFLQLLIGGSFAAFSVALALPALAIRTLSLVKKEVVTGDRLVYATGDRTGQEIKAADLAVGGVAQAFPKGKETNQNNLIQLVNIGSGGAGGLVAYSAICTHLGCAVLGKLDADGHILCPCHGSLYDPAKQAAVLRGPAGRALPSLPVAVGADGIVVTDGVFSGPIGPQ